MKSEFGVIFKTTLLVLIVSSILLFTIIKREQYLKMKKEEIIHYVGRSWK